jgi:hypothetical protein
MADIILDTNILSEMLAQFFKNRVGAHNIKFIENGALNERAVREINKIVEWHNSSIDSVFPGLVIASSFGFVEIARKFEEISCRQYTIQQFAAFIEQPPEWFLIVSVDTNLFHFLTSIPGYVTVGSGSKPVEWADAIHVATAFSRDEHWWLATTDVRIKAIPALEGKLI